VEKQRAVITGAGSGIGYATQVKLLDLDYEVVAIGRNPKTLRESKEALGPKGDKVRILEADVSDGGTLRALLKDVGPVHALVANAGICCQARLDDPNSDQIWRDVLATNLDGVWNTLRSVVPLLVPNGRAVVVSSGLGKLGRAGYSAYSASKHAVLGLVKCLAQELAEIPITINAVCPGWVDTKMAEADLETTANAANLCISDVKKAALANIPLNRFVQPKEVANLICWLLSKEAQAITGQSFNISCGEFFA